MKPKTMRTILNRLHEMEARLQEQERKETWLLAAILTSVFLNVIALYRLLQ